MRIFGDTACSPYKVYEKESHLCFGHRDVLKGKPQTVTCVTLNMFGEWWKTKTIEPKLQLHISRDAISSFTGKLREYLLPWRWKSAYLDREDGSQPQRILVRQSSDPDHFKNLLGRSWFITNLIQRKIYSETFGREYISVPAPTQSTRIVHPLGQWYGYCHSHGPNQICHIYRQRSLFSTLRYQFLKNFSTSWKEVDFQVSRVSQKVLIRKSDETTFSLFQATFN